MVHRKAGIHKRYCPKDFILILKASAGSKLVIVCAKQGKIIFGKTRSSKTGILVTFDDIFGMLPAFVIHRSAGEHLCIKVITAEKSLDTIDRKSVV